MSKTVLAILMGAVALIVLAVIFEVSFATGVSGLLFLVGLGYAYVVARREVELLNYAVNQDEE